SAAAPRSSASSWCPSVSRTMATERSRRSASASTSASASDDLHVTLPSRYTSFMITTLIVSAVLAAVPSVDDLNAVARLPGEPSVVSAVGMTRDDRPILTLENSSAFDAESTKRRVVVYAGASSDAASAAVLEAVRWFKTQAPRELRDQWSVSALPAVAFADGDEKSFVRWCTFQAPDVAIEFVDGHAASGVDHRRRFLARESRSRNIAVAIR